MTWEEISAAAEADTPIVIPIGATEQHGRHLPVCTDWVLPQRVLCEAGRVRDIVVGPFLPFGYRSRPGSGGGQHFPGTVSLRATTFMSVLEDVLSELRRGGFRNIVLYNWHFENSGFIYEPAFLVVGAASRTQDRGDRGRLPGLHPGAVGYHLARRAFRDWHWNTPQ